MTASPPGTIVLVQHFTGPTYCLVVKSGSWSVSYDLFVVHDTDPLKHSRFEFGRMLRTNTVVPVQDPEEWTL